MKKVVKKQQQNENVCVVESEQLELEWKKENDVAARERVCVEVVERKWRRNKQTNLKKSNETENTKQQTRR